MKKMIFPLAASLVLLASGCSEDETVQVPKGNGIAFAHTFVDKASRASDTDINNISHCKVWGSSSADGAFIFDGTALDIQQNGVSTYTSNVEPYRYWVTNSDYHFMAIASNKSVSTPGWTFTKEATLPTNNGGFGTLAFDNTVAQGLEDVVYATNDASTTGVDLSTTAMNKVELKFKHALSRLRFTFKNTMPGYKMVISDVYVSGLPASGELDFSNSTLAWTVAADNTYDRLDFIINNGYPSEITHNAVTTSVAMFSIPTSSFNVHFKVQLYIKGEGDTWIPLNNSNPYVHEVTINKQLEIGNAYAFNANLGGDNVNPDGMKPIEFTATVDPWAYNQVDYEIKEVEQQP